MGLIPAQEAAERLGVDPSRVRQLAAAGQLSAERIGGLWFLDEGSVESRLKRRAQAGRPFEPRNAWSLLLLASGQRPNGIDGSVLSRLKRILRENDLENLAYRLVKRGEKKAFRSHPGELKYILEDRDFLATGISAAGHLNLDLVSGAEADGYVRESKLEELLAGHALKPDREGNVLLRIVPDESWDLLRGNRTAPQAAVALDLLEDSDARSRSAAHQAFESLREHSQAGQIPGNDR